MGRDGNPMTRQEFADHTRTETVRYATEEAARIREGLAAGRYPETVDDLRAGEVHMTRAEAEARVAEMEARIAAPEIPPREVMDAAYDRYVHNVRDQRAAAEAPRPTPYHTRAMIERAASDAVRSANPEAWAAAQAARSQDIGGARPRTETPVGRVAAEIAEMDARIAEADAVLRQAAQQGRITEAELRALDVSDMEARAQERGRGLEAGAACLIMNGARP